MDLKEKRIIITGGAGFLGGFIVEKLKQNEEVPDKNIFVPRSKDYDLRREEDIKKMFQDFPADIVIHLAAKVGGIGFNQENPATLFYDNLIMGAQLMEQSRLNNVEKFVAVGTICAYPKFTPVPFKEEDLWQGYPEETNASYGLAKKMMLVQSQAYRKQYNFNSIFLLPVNLYGPRDNFNPNSSHVIPALIKKIKDAKEAQTSLNVWGTGNASREFLYVEDCAEAIILATKHYEKADPINLGAGKEITIRNLVRTLCDLMEYQGEINWDTSKPDGQPRRCLDTSKAELEFGFKSKTLFEEGLKKTIDWYENYFTEDLNFSSHQNSQEQLGTRAQKISKKALIFGVTGQDGSYLTELLLEKGYEVYGVVRRSSSFNTGRLDHIYEDPHEKRRRLKLIYGDLSNSSNISKIIRETMPDEIYNLAAQSHVRTSFDVPEYTAEITGIGTLRILEALRDFCPETKFYQASSSEMFGKVLESPQKETTPFYPRSPYGCSKVFSFETTRNYRESYGLFACNGILFNHESERRGKTFVTRKITRGLARIRLGIDEKLYLGNLDAKRDWGHAKDYVYAMWLMLQQASPDDYVIATGESHTVREFAELTAKKLGFDLVWEGEGINEKGMDKNTGKIIIEIDPKYFRPAEVETLLGDSSKAKEKLGWNPAINFYELVTRMLEHDLRQEAILLKGKTDNH